MRPHTKIYMNALGYDISDFIPSELPPHNKAVDIHHIDSRKMGGSRSKDRIENLMALTREEHDKYGDKKQYRRFLIEAHREFLIKNKVPFSQWYFDHLLKKVEHELSS